MTASNKSCLTCINLRSGTRDIQCNKGVFAKFPHGALPTKLLAADQCPFYDAGVFISKRMEQLMQKGYTVDEAFEIDEREAIQGEQ